MGGDDGDGAIGRVEGSFPAGAGVDIIEVGCAVSVCLRPFAAQGGPEAVVPMSKRLRTLSARNLTQLWCPHSTSSDPSIRYKHTAPSPCDSRRSD